MFIFRQIPSQNTCVFALCFGLQNECNVEQSFNAFAFAIAYCVFGVLIMHQHVNDTSFMFVCLFFF